MQLRTTLLALLFSPLFVILPVSAGDFDWLRSLSAEAQNNPDGLRARLATRFNIGDAEVQAVISNIGGHADAYMVLRLAEMSHRPVVDVTDHYRSSKPQGWGNFAKSLGIKPGSREFHALKAGHDLAGYPGYYAPKKKNKAKAKQNDQPVQGKGN